MRLFSSLLSVILLSCVVAGCSRATPGKASTPSAAASSSSSADSSALTSVRRFRPGRPFTGDPVDLCVILTGQMYGYLQPCGCSRPQVGGLERRYELMQRFAQAGYALSAGDLGDLAPKEQARPQNRWKYESAVNMLKSMSYAAIGMGPTEMAMPLDTALGLAQNYQPPLLVAANLLDEQGLYPDMFKPWVMDDPRRVEDHVAVVARLQGMLAGPTAGVIGLWGTLPISGRPRVGYLGLVGDSIINECAEKKLELKFKKPAEALAGALKGFLAAGPEVKVLLFQGSATEASTLLKNHPKVFDVVLCRNDASDGVAPLLPIKDDSGAWIIMVGHKGRSTGVVAYRRGKPLEYRLEELVEELELPDNKTNPTREIMKEYVWGVYRNNYLKEVVKISHPHQLEADTRDAVFVGPGKCRECHPQAFAVWANSKHSHGWDDLVKLGRPIAEVPQKDMPVKLVGRQYDPDCVSCHVTGYGFKGGFEDEAKSVHLFGNTCENCHGPGSLHAGQPGNPVYRKPMKMSMEDKDKVGQMCMKCHDLDNDPHFDISKWEKIKHGREK